MSKKKTTKKPSAKKPAAALTDAEALKRLFPKAVRDTVKKEAEAADKKGGGKAK